MATNTTKTTTAKKATKKVAAPKVTATVKTTPSVAAKATAAKAATTAKTAATKATDAAKVTTAKAASTAKIAATKAATSAKTTTASATTNAKSAANKATDAAKATTAKATSTMKQATNAPISKAKEVGYTAVGLGVMGAQKLGQQGKALLDASPVDLHLSENLSMIKDQAKTFEGKVVRQATKLDDAMEQFAMKVETAARPLEAKLPANAREQLNKAKTGASNFHRLVRSTLLESSTKR